jgi:transglutaminase-like putative cysteine protease
MPIFSITHLTDYRYQRCVAFGEHRMMLRPRDDEDQRVIQVDLAISPKPEEVAWDRDQLNNHFAIARFSEQSDQLRFVSNIRLDHTARPFLASDIEDYARNYPFQYTPEDLLNLQQFIFPVPLDSELRLWSDQFFRGDGRADTFDLLNRMTQTIFRTFRHANRHEEGIQEPAESIALKSGSCRDLAALMMAVLRSRGIAARFVSGYMHLSDDEQEDQLLNGGNTHAWLQGYIPGPGWIDFDPSAGTMGNENLVRVAAVTYPDEAIPLQGTWYGHASDHLAMTVAVKVNLAD